MDQEQKSVPTKAIKLLEENIASSLQDTGIGKYLVEKPQAVKGKIDKWNYIKLNGYFTAKNWSTK